MDAEMHSFPVMNNADSESPSNSKTEEALNLDGKNQRMRRWLEIKTRIELTMSTQSAIRKFQYMGLGLEELQALSLIHISEPTRPY